jgi:hypothetical protein
MKLLKNNVVFRKSLKRGLPRNFEGSHQLLGASRPGVRLEILLSPLFLALLRA